MRVQSLQRMMSDGMDMALEIPSTPPVKLPRCVGANCEGDVVRSRRSVHTPPPAFCESSAEAEVSSAECLQGKSVAPIHGNLEDDRSQFLRGHAKMGRASTSVDAAHPFGQGPRRKSSRSPLPTVRPK